MSELLTSAQMRAIEAAAIESGAVTGLELMERAGRGVVDAVLAQWPELVQGHRRALVLCGPGNNGGDGFVVARLLKDAGWAVDVFLYGDVDKLPPDAKVNCERWLERGQVSPLNDDALDGYAEDHPGTTLAIDALFGTGLTRPFDDLARVQMELNFWQASSHHDDTPRVVAVDIPSGICADSGRYLAAVEDPFDHCVTANLTVTFHRPKLGHYLNSGQHGAGKLVVADIGLADEVPVDSVMRVKTPLRSALAKIAFGYKFSNGHALIMSGGPARTGAARLGARGALRIGAGVVTLGVPPSAQMEVAGHVTAVMVKRIADGAALAEILTDDRINALCLGPALGLDDDHAELIETVLDKGAHERAPYVVLDADALTLVAKHAGLLGKLHEKCVLTPHAGEFARLFPDIAETLNAPATTGPAYSKVDATRAAAIRAGCTVLFKGPDTVIASPNGRCSINSSAYDRAAPWLATAGSGDVLAGFITGLLARGFGPQQAAEMGAFLHTECALSFGAGLIAEDLPEELPTVFKALGL